MYVCAHVCVCESVCDWVFFFSFFFLKWIEMSALNIPNVLKHSVKILPGVRCIDMKAICCCDKEFMMERRRIKDSPFF